MPQDAISQLDSTVADVFSRMLAFTCTPVQQAPPPTPSCLTATVDFSGQSEGFCALQVEPAGAAKLTLRLTGVQDREDSDPLLADTVGELCNMIAGNWKSRHAPPPGSFTLSPPCITTGSTSQLLPGLTRCYVFERHTLTIRLNLASASQRSPATPKTAVP